jgi:hypothetical protein
VESDIAGLPDASCASQAGWDGAAVTHSQDGQGGITSDADATRAVTALYQEHALGLTRLAFVWKTGSARNCGPNPN